MPPGVSYPRPFRSSQPTTPSAAARPNALPPVISTAWTREAFAIGFSRSISRVPGPPPRTSPEATAPSGGASTTVQPVAASRVAPVAGLEAGRERRLAHRAVHAPAARSALAVAADVGAAAGGDELRDGPAAARARLSLAQVDQELVLHRAALAVRVAVVVDRRALVREPRLERLDDARVQALEVGAAQPAGRLQRMDAGAEQRLVRVDVPDAGDPALVEQERLHGRACGRAPPRAAPRA